MSNYNKTQLTPQKEFERHIYHRDQFAHYFRWSHVLKNAKREQKILDFGCGSGEMLELFYRNKFRPERYLGLDIRENTIKNNIVNFINLDFADFEARDLCEPFDLNEKFDIITCFEVIEHIGHKNADVFLQNIANHCDKNTTVYLSTPNYDPCVGAAENHILGPEREIGEWNHNELEEKLSQYFTIEKKYGTFASIRDYDYLLAGWKKEMYNALKEYYDVNLLACLMAPFFPKQARNCLWILKRK